MSSFVTQQDQDTSIEQDSVEIEYRKKYEVWYPWKDEQRIVFEGDLLSMPDQLLDRLVGDIECTLESINELIEHYTQVVASLPPHHIDQKSMYDAKKRRAMFKRRRVVNFWKKVITLTQGKKRKVNQLELLNKKHEEFKESCFKARIAYLLGKDAYKAIYEFADIEAMKTLEVWANQTQLATPEEVEEVNGKITKSRQIRVSHCGHDSVDEFLRVNLPVVLLQKYTQHQERISRLQEDKPQLGLEEAACG